MCYNQSDNVYEYLVWMDFRRVLFCFQAEDGIRDSSGTGVQTFAFLISSRRRHTRFKCDWSSDVCSSDLMWRLRFNSDSHDFDGYFDNWPSFDTEANGPALNGMPYSANVSLGARSEERRVGKECRSRWSPYH